MEQANTVQCQAEKLDCQRIDMDQQCLQEQDDIAAIAAQLEEEKRKLQQSREELVATLPSVDELREDFRM
eukprot:11836998-Ditylum_brightwellii.AAC.1